MSLHPSNGNFLGPALAGACIAVVLSVPTAAWTARIIGDTYEVRAIVYCSFLLWVVCGAIYVFVQTWRGEQGQLSFGKIILWFASVWLWPLLLLVALLKRKHNSPS